MHNMELFRLSEFQIWCWICQNGCRNLDIIWGCIFLIVVSFASSVTFDLSLEDLIQGLGDTSWVLVEGWDGGTSGRVKSQLPSLGLGHVWGTTYIPSSLWKQALASLSMTCMISDPDWFHPFSCPASPETSLVSLQEFLFIYLFFKFWLYCLHYCSGLLYLQRAGATL